MRVVAVKNSPELFKVVCKIVVEAGEIIQAAQGQNVSPCSLVQPGWSWVVLHLLYGPS